jgi:purine-binding chemotaxis protein CheW
MENELANRLMVFRLSSEIYGIKLSFIKEVLANQVKITSVPNSPSYYLGILNLRGDLISVIDLKKRFSLESEELTQSVIIIAEVKGKLFGFLVDEIIRVTSVEEVKKASFSSSQESEVQTVFSHFIESVCQLKDHLTLVLKIDVFLEDESQRLEKDFSRS